MSSLFYIFEWELFVLGLENAGLHLYFEGNEAFIQGSSPASTAFFLQIRPLCFWTSFSNNNKLCYSIMDWCCQICVDFPELPEYICYWIGTTTFGDDKFVYPSLLPTYLLDRTNFTFLLPLMHDFDIWTTDCNLFLAFFVTLMHNQFFFAFSPRSLTIVSSIAFFLSKVTLE